MPRELLSQCDCEAVVFSKFSFIAAVYPLNNCPSDARAVYACELNDLIVALPNRFMTCVQRHMAGRLSVIESFARDKRRP